MHLLPFDTLSSSAISVPFLCGCILAYNHMITVEEALKLVDEHARPLAPRRVALKDAAGLMLAEDVASDINSPPYDKALMDGYAVVAGDRLAERRVLEEVAAGDVPRRPVTPGCATRVMTGAPLPEGADAIIPIEQTEMINDDTVRLAQVEPSPGQHIMRLGTSLRAGEVVLRSGAVLRPIEIAILAEIGHGVVSVRPRPRVAVLPTGNELVQVGEKPGVGQIRNSNGPMLVAAAMRAGADGIDLPIARDAREHLRARVEAGLKSDILLLSGGVSAGKFDLVPEVLAELGVEQVFHKIALRPGKPLWFGVKKMDERAMLVFGLPGNPVSGFVCFELFVRSAIAALAGRGFTAAGSVPARLSHAFTHKGGRAACLPARISYPTTAADGNREVANAEILPWHGSADMATLSQANGLVRLPVEPLTLAAGALINILPV
jgi:molybdopterin molybdotransferase